MLQTSLCRQLGIEYPIFSVGMGGGMAGPELAAAVSNVGGCGVLGMGGLPAPYIRQQIQTLRPLTNKPFGINIILPLLQEGQIETCLDEKIPILILFWGDPKPAEGHARSGVREFQRFVSIALGSVAELETQVILSADLGYLVNQMKEDLLPQLDTVGKMLRGLQKSLETRS